MTHIEKAKRAAQVARAVELQAKSAWFMNSTPEAWRAALDAERASGDAHEWLCALLNPPIFVLGWSYASAQDFIAGEPGLIALGEPLQLMGHSKPVKVLRLDGWRQRRDVTIWCEVFDSVQCKFLTAQANRSPT